MEETKNDRRLKILQERLAQIEKKQEKEIANNVNSIEEKNTPEIKEIKNPSWGLEEKNKKTFRWKRYTLIIIILYGVFYGYSNIDIIATNKEKESTELPSTSSKVEYNLNITHNYQKGAQIAIINSFEEESSAKAMVNQLRVKGFECDYFYLPENSNSQKKIFKIFIGPYESLEEVNQWKKIIKDNVEIINL